MILSIDARITALQHKMRAEEIDACIVLSSDPHLSEYLPAYWQLRQWFSGFTGSAGTLVVLKDQAYVWTDSRYWVQAEKELKGTKLSLQKSGTPDVLPYPQYLARHLKENAVVAVLAETIAVEAFFDLEELFDKAGIEMVTDFDPFSEIWQDRPALPQNPVYPHQGQFVSQTRADKLTKIYEEMRIMKADYHLVSTLDDIAWILNLRGNDISYNPLFLAYLLIEEGRAALYIDESKLSVELKALLSSDGVSVRPYGRIYDDLADLKNETCLMLDFSRTTLALMEAVDGQISLIPCFNPSTLAKACKSREDIAHIRQAMESDGVALCHFFSDFEAKLAQGEQLSELSVVDMLFEARAQHPLFVSLSFSTIAGFNENGALPHYRASKDAYSLIEGNGLLLIDSGAQYQNGTTDITRVVPIGTLSDAQKKDFTLVLKAMITMSTTHFPHGIKMPYLDVIARAPLWQAHLDYGHGTGHGIGYFMNVHEGPHSLSYHAKVLPQSEVKPGMMTSIEPGLYREGHWGIRIENLVVVREAEARSNNDFGAFMSFETLTLCPIDTRCIHQAYLSEKEIKWLNDYHAEVYARLSPKIENEQVLMWLKERTAPI